MSMAYQRNLKRHIDILLELSQLYGLAPPGRVHNLSGSIYRKFNNLSRNKFPELRNENVLLNTHLARINSAAASKIQQAFRKRRNARRKRAANIISTAAHRALNRPVFNRVATTGGVPVHFVGSRARKMIANLALI